VTPLAVNHPLDDEPGYIDLKGALMDLGIAERSARRMIKGQSRMPPSVMAELGALLRKEARRLDAMAATLEADAAERLTAPGNASAT
jgi:hypothetical protein